MAELSREEKVAAAQLKLKRFQQAKGRKIGSNAVSSQSSTISGTAVNYFHGSSNLSNTYGNCPTDYTGTSTAIPLFDVGTPLQSSAAVSDASAKSRSLADYFGPQDNDSANVIPSIRTDGAPEWLAFTPSSYNLPEPTTVNTVPPTEEQFSAKELQQKDAAPLYNSSAVPLDIPATQAEWNNGSEAVQLVEQHPTSDSAPDQMNSFQSGLAEEEKFDNTPTATTERIMQLSRQLNGILENSEQLVTNFGSSSILYSSPSSDAIEFDPSRSTFDGHTQGPGYSSPFTGRSSPTSFSNPATLNKRSGTPNSAYSANPASSYLRELEERNVELASLLEKRTRAHERALAKLSAVQEQSTRAANQAASDRVSLEAAAQRDLSKAQDQIRAHAQTIGALVAEKTELQTKVQHLERLAQQRAQEIEDLNGRMQTFRKHSVEMESTIAASKVELEKALVSNGDLKSQVERLQADVNREKSLRETFQSELEEANSRLTSRSFEITQLEVNINDLRRQLELAQVYTTQLTGTEIGSTLGTSERMQTANPDDPNSNEPVSEAYSAKDWLAERESLINRLREHEQSLSQMSRDRDRLESQYQSYVAQVEQQATQLRSQLSEANRSNQELELTIDTVRRQLREKEDELISCRGELEATRVQVADASASNPPVVESLQTQSVMVSTAPPAPMPDAQLVELQHALDERTTEVDKLTHQVSELIGQLDAAREALAEKETLLADRDMVLATATSERVALSRAVEQNRTLKEQLTELQDSFAQMSNKNVELTTALRQEQQAHEESEKLLVDCRVRLEQLQNQCAQLETEHRMTHLSCDAHAHGHLDDQVVAESVPSVMTAHSTEHASCDAHNEQLEKLVCELQASQRTIDGLSGRAEELDSVVHRMGLLLDWLQTQQVNPQSTARLHNTLSDRTISDPIEQVVQLDHLVRKIIAQRDEEVATQARQNQEHQSMVKNLPSLEEWQTHQVAFKQLEAKFIDCMDKMSRVDEERTRLELLNVQLEMEASTVGEYVTLFAHRRAAAARRARAREQLLRRLVQDRRRLRKRLHNLLGSVESIGPDQSSTVDMIESSIAVNALSKVFSNEELQAKFLANFQQLLQEIGPSTDETESDSGFSLLNDEDAAEQNETSEVSDSLLNSISEEDEPAAKQIDEKLVSQLSVSPLEQLRKQALQHDCPHCQCCVGNLIEV